MIDIKIEKATKCNGEWSLYVTFPYDNKVVDVMRSFPSRFWNGDSKSWELPLKCFKSIIDALPDYDFDIHGNWKAFEEKKAVDFYPNHTLFLSKKDGKYGYTNAKGELVVEYTYDDAKEQNEYGYCSVKKGSVWGALNSVGNVVVKPSVNLDSNLLIDCIGTWHLAEDLNMYYYEK